MRHREWKQVSCSLSVCARVVAIEVAAAVSASASELDTHTPSSLPWQTELDPSFLANIYMCNRPDQNLDQILQIFLCD